MPTRGARCVIQHSARAQLSPWHFARKQASDRRLTIRSQWGSIHLPFSTTRQVMRQLRLPPELIYQLVPHISPVSRATIATLCLWGGALVRSEAIAGHVGVASRHALARELRRDGLPGPGRLGAWIDVLGSVWQWEQHGRFDGTAADHDPVDPFVRYRRIRRMTGVTWRDLRARGLPWALAAFSSECGGIGKRECLAEVG